MFTKNHVGGVAAFVVPARQHVLEN